MNYLQDLVSSISTTEVRNTPLLLLLLLLGALAVDDGGAALQVLLPRDPQLVETAQGGHDAAAQPGAQRALRHPYGHHAGLVSRRAALVDQHLHCSIDT